MKTNLFGIRSNDTKFERIETSNGSIHLEKRGRVRTKENPIDLQEADRSRADLVLLINKASAKLAASKGLDQEDARARECFFPRFIEGALVLATERISDWLTDDENREMTRLNLQTANRVKAATLFIKHRLGYHVEVVADAKAKTTKLLVAPLQWEIAAGAKIKIDGVLVETVEYAEIDAEELFIKQAPKPIKACTGFICDPSTSQPLVGAPWWTEENSGDLDTEQVEAIYQFYLQEVNAVTAEGKQPPTTNSENSPDQSQLIGSSVLLESEATESQTHTSTSTDSETAIAV
jgi:hypothetical protein